MSKDVESILKIVIKKQDDLDKNHSDTNKIIAKINKQLKDIDNKINLILEILNNFTILLLEEEEGNEESSEYNQDWIPEQSESWNSYDDDDDEQELN